MAGPLQRGRELQASLAAVRAQMSKVKLCSPWRERPPTFRTWH